MKYWFFLQTLIVSCNSIRFKVIDLAIRNFAIANSMKYFARYGIQFLFPSSKCQNCLSIMYQSSESKRHIAHIFSQKGFPWAIFWYIFEEKNIGFSLPFISYLCMIFLPQGNYFWNVLDCSTWRQLTFYDVGVNVLPKMQ